MKTQRALRGLSVLALAAIAGASTASAQEPDDFSFAKRLAYRGWFDLAGDVCARIERDHSLPRDVRAALPILLAEIDLAKADREPDPEQAMQYMSDSISRLQKFIADESSHPRIFEAQINIGFLKSRKARALVERMDGAKSPDDHDRYRQEAVRLYTEITEDFDKSAQDWKRLPTTPELEGAIMDARLEANRARYDNARVPGHADADRRKLFEDAQKNLVEFQFDYGNTAKGFEAMLMEGRCFFELGDYPQAETRFNNAMELLSTLKEHDIARNSYFDQIIYGSYLSKAQLLLKSNRPKDAQKFIEGVFKSDPVSERDWVGDLLKVELVEALYRLKSITEARDVAEKVIAANGPAASRMRDMLGKLGKGHAMPPDQSLNVARGSMDKGRLRDALGTLRQAVEACTTAEDRAKYMPQALFLMAQCLQEMRRNYEAAIVYEKVFGQFPKHELGVKSCWEAIVCYSTEFDNFEDPADEQEKDRLMNTLLRQWPGAKEGDNIPYLQGLKLENARQLREASDKYLQVPERAPAYERALVRGAYCLRADAFREYARLRKQDPVAEKAIVDQLTRAEELFKKFLARAAETTTDGPEAARDRATLVTVVNQELAFLYNHKLVGRAQDSLNFLEKLAKDLPADDDRMAQIHKLQIQSQLALNLNDEAVKTMELLFDRFPHERETAEACKSVAIRLDEITSDAIAKLQGKELDEATKENLKKVSRYYDKWLKGAMAFNLDARVTDVIAVANTLYLTARRLNNIPDSVYSFMDLRKGMIVAWKNYFEEAEFVHSLLVSDQFRSRVPPKELMTLMARRARCLSFIADQSEGWLRAKSAYESIRREFKIEDDKGGFNPGVVVGQPELLAPYLELGAVYFELGRWNKIHYDNAIAVCANVTAVAAADHEPWWIARFMTINSHFLRGKEKDILTAQIGLKMLQENYPDFDGGKYGLKDRFIELKRRIDSGGR